MAASSAFSFSNFLSFILPSKPPPPKTPPPSQLNLSSSSSSSSRFFSQTNHKSADGFAPLVAEDGEKHNSCLSEELSSVICPSLAYSNTLFFSRPYNVEIYVDDDETEDQIVARFRREVMNAGIIQECKRRRFFETKREKKKRKAREAAKRNRRRPFNSRYAGEGKLESSKPKDDDDDDNWDLPEEDAPY